MTRREYRLKFCRRQVRRDDNGLLAHTSDDFYEVFDNIEDLIDMVRIQYKKEPFFDYNDIDIQCEEKE